MSEVYEQLMQKLVAASLTAKASDVHLRAGHPPFVRVDGQLTRGVNPVLTPEMVEGIIVHTAGPRTELAEQREWEYSFEISPGQRVRGHAFRERNAWAVTFRLIPNNIPTFQELRLPAAAKHFAERQQGLVLITGPTGSGKTTTAASLLKATAAASPCHIVTIEDPIEYQIDGTAACVSQREVGRDTRSFEDGLRAVLREDPDLIFVGEVRDRYSLDVAMQAAETGHAVVTTFHTPNASQTLLRLLSMYSAEEQVAARERLADCLRGILSQRLLPRKRTRGRILCTEVLVNNYTVKELIRDASRMKTLPSVLERGADKLMHSLDQDLAVLVSEGLVEAEVALAHASSPNDLRRALSLSGHPA